MKKVDAATGLAWIRQGFLLYKERPFFLTNIFVAYFIFILVLSMLPVLGNIIPPLMAPLFSVFFLQIIHDVSEKKAVDVNEIFAVYTPAIIRRLVMLGGIYLCASLMALYVSSFVDGGIFMRMMGGEQFDNEALQASNFQYAFLTAALVNCLVLALLWFVAPLIAWRNMPIMQSLFYSFFSLLRTWRAFLVYMLGLILFAFFVPMLINSLVMLMLGRNFGLIFSFAMLMVVAVLIYCSFYTMYIAIFGKPRKRPVSN